MYLNFYGGMPCLQEHYVRYICRDNSQYWLPFLLLSLLTVW